jgi:hypothetical protein
MILAQWLSRPTRCISASLGSRFEALTDPPDFSLPAVFRAIYQSGRDAVYCAKLQQGSSPSKLQKRAACFDL